MKPKLQRIVFMLTPVVTKFDGVAESPIDYEVVIEHEHKREPEPSRASKDVRRERLAATAWQAVAKWKAH